MGSRYTKGNLLGFGEPESTFTYADRDTATLSYTEASPRPGNAIGDSARSKLEPEVRGGQDTDLDVYVARAGFPHIGPLGTHGATVIQRVSGGTWKGWNHPGVIGPQHQLASWSSSADYAHLDCVTHPSTGKVIASYAQDYTTTVPWVKVFDPSTNTWDGGTALFTDATSNRKGDTALAVLPDESIIALSVLDDGAGGSGVVTWTLYRSTDAGGTWSAVADAPFGLPVPGALASKDVGSFTAIRTRILADDNGNVLFFREYDDGASKAVQYASSSLGTRFNQVGGTWSASPPTSVNLLRLADGSIGMVCVVGSDMQFRKIGSVYDSLEEADAVTIVGSTPTRAVAWVDDDGVIYAGTQTMALYYSRDNGASWVALDPGPYWSGDSSTLLRAKAATASMGKAFVLANSTDGGGGGTTYDGMVWALQLGGWSNLEVDGYNDTNVQAALTYIPYELPTTISQLSEAGAGTATLVTPGALQVTTTSNTLYWTDALSSAFYDVKGEVDIEVQSGGSTSVAQVVVRINSGDGANRAQANIYFSTTQYSVRDGATDRGAVTHGATGRVQVKFQYNDTDGTLSTWYKEPEDDDWTLGHDAVTISKSVSASTSEVVFGHIASSTSQSDWYGFHFKATTSLGTLEIRSSQTDYIGKAIGGYAYPLPGIGPDDQIARLALTGGPGFVGDGFDLDASSDYPLSNLYWDVSPSPRAKWRGTGVADSVIAAWDAGQGTLPGQSMFVACFGFNVPLLNFDAYNGSWSTIAQVQFGVGFQNVSYQITGDVLRADTTGTSGDRFVHHNEFAGGFIDFNSGTRYRKIRRNTAGEFTVGSDSSIPKALFYIDDADGTEASTGTCTIYSPNAVRIVHNVGDYTKFRLAIPSQSNADSYHEGGLALMGGLVVPGNRHGDGWTWRAGRNASVRSDRSGTTYATREGPAPRTLRMSFQDGMNMYPLRNGTELDYLAADSGNPLAARGSAPTTLLALVDAWKSGEVPIVVIPSVPAVGTTLTDPTRFLLARLASDAQIDHVKWGETTGELYRSTGLTFEEIV